MEKAEVRDVEKMQEEIKKETPVSPKDKKLYKYLYFKCKSLY